MPEKRRDEQKLWLILFQIKALRARLNLLVVQRWLFTTLGVTIGAAALVYLAALWAGPLTFLTLGAVVIMVALAGIFRSALIALRSRADLAKAARIGDERGGLKGRLTTVLALAESPRHSALWPYLVEDTYGLREEYSAARIEPRLLSRSIFGFLAALLLAVLIAPFRIYGHLPTPMGSLGLPGGAGEVTADINNLDIRPADPALQPNAEVYADSATIKKLEEKIAAAQNSDRKDGSGFSKMVDKAREFADAFQGRLTGHDSSAPPPARLRLTDRNPGSTVKNGDEASSKKGSGGDGLANNSRQDAHGSNGQAGSPSAKPPMASLPAQQADQLAQNNSPMANGPGKNNSHPGTNDAPSPPVDGGTGAGNGPNHGSGSDPEHLFSSASQPPLGSDSFKIAIEAEPSDESTSPGSPGYIPPKVRVPLNSTQHPDEPLARSMVPAADQMTIKRVFER